MKIDLKHNYKEKTSVPSASMDYPMLHMAHPDLHKMPKSGHARVKYKVVSHSAHKNEGDKKAMHSVGMAIHSFEPEEPAEKPTDQSAMEELLEQQ